MASQRSGAVVVDLVEFRRKREEREQADKPQSAPAVAPHVVWVPAVAAPSIAPMWGYWVMPYWGLR